MCSVALHGRWVARAWVLTQPGLQSLILSLYFHRDRLKVLSLYFHRTDPGSFPLPSFSYRITYHISHAFSLRVYQAAHATSALLDLRNVVSSHRPPSPFRPENHIFFNYIVRVQHASADMPWESSNRGTLPGGGSDIGATADAGAIPVHVPAAVEGSLSLLEASAVEGSLSSLEASVAAAQARVGRLEKQ